MNEYSKNIHNQASEIGRELLEKLLANKEVIVPDVIDEQEGKAKLQEETLDFGNEIVQYLATKDIPARYATMGIEKLIDALTGLKTFVDGTLTMYEDELLSRVLGVKNDDGKYRRENASVAQIVLKLEEIKQSTGNDRGDFFNDVAPAMPSNPEQQDAIPSPFVSETPAPDAPSEEPSEPVA